MSSPSARNLLVRSSISRACHPFPFLVILNQVPICVAAGGVLAVPDGAVAPAWFGPAFAVGIAPLTAQMAILSARLQNAHANRNNDPLLPLPDNAGAPPPAFFPATRGALGSMTVGNLDNLLNFYGLAPGGSAAAKKNRLRVHLNVPQPEF